MITNVELRTLLFYIVILSCFCKQSLEAQRLEQLAKERERAQEVMAKAQQESKEFSDATKEKLRRSMEANKENREAQIKALQERLREHVWG